MLAAFKTLKKLDLIICGAVVLAYAIYFAWDYAQGTNFLSLYFATPHSSPFPYAPAPQRYRITLYFITWGLSIIKRFIPALDFHLMWTWTHWVATCVALVTFYLLLRVYLELSRFFATVGMLAIAAAYPLIFLYHPHVQGGFSDTLGYAAIGLALLVLFSGNIWGFIAMCILAITVREANVFIGLVLLFDRQANGLQKALALVLPVAAHLIIRYFREWESQYLWIGINQNLATPIVSNVLSIFATHGVFWVLGLLGWLYLAKNRNELDRPLWLLWSSAPLVLAAMLGANTVWAVLTENHILFVTFYWVVGLGITFLDRWRFANVSAKQFLSAGITSAIVLTLTWIFYANIQTVTTALNFIITWYQSYGIPGELEYIVFNVVISLFIIALVVIKRKDIFTTAPQSN